MDIISGITTPCGSNLETGSLQLFLTLINTLTAAQCPLGSKDSYPEDYSSNLGDGDEFDFIIIGAGSSGSVLANTLSEQSDRLVLVLEAGIYPSANSDIPSTAYGVQQSREDWMYLTEPSNTSCFGYIDGRCRWPRGKLLGGCSSMNAMMYIRGNKGDYDEWADLGNVGWDYESILQLYLENEHVISQPNNSNAEYGKDGFQIISWYDNNNLVSRAITDGASELGYPTLLTENPLSPLGYFQALVTINNGVRANAARGFLGQVKNRTNLFVATNVTVTKVLIDQDLKATGVQIKVGDDLLEINASKEVIVSAGSINTPQILMLSGVGPLSHLNDLGIKVLQDLPVGQNLQDHLYIPVPVQMNGSAVTNQPRSAAIDNLYQYFSYRTGPVGTLGMSNLQGFINTKNNSIYPNMQVVESFNPPGDQNGLPAFLRVTGYSPEIAQQYVEINRLNASASFYSILLKPESRGSILLNSTNPLDKPLIYSGYLTDENDYDLETLLEGVRYTQRLLQTNPLRKLNATTVPLILPNCPELEFDTDDYWKCFIRTLGSTLYHPVGTSKMGPDSDPTSVVDPRLRVRGISNLRVADASIMPRIISGNTNAISLAIGLNAGKLINEDWS